MAGFKTQAPAVRLKRAWIVAAGLILIAPGAHAQVQRSFINPSFEQPIMPGTACWSIRAAADVPGWESTEGPYSGTWGTAQRGACGGHPPVPVVGAMQMFKNGWQDSTRPPVNASHGTQWAELNAFTPSRLYQNVCLSPGERIDWSIDHRGRAGTEAMEFNIGPTPNGAGSTMIVQARTTNVGVGQLDACGLGTCDYDGTTDTWARYSGNFIWSGAAGLQTIGFTSRSGGSAGNYLDNVQLTLRPYVEFRTANAVTREGEGSTGVPAIRVAGVIATAFDVEVTITGGTAIMGTDFTAPGSTFPVTILAGDYGAGQDFTLPLAVIDDAIVDDNRTVMFGIASNPSNYAVGNTSTCGAPATAVITWTIIDNDIDLATTKAASTASPVIDIDFTYIVTYVNNTARPTVAPLDVHDATATITDVLPADVLFNSWTCQASNGASCPGGAVNGSTSGSGAINGSAMLPAGNAAAGGSLTYTITARLDTTATCTAITNIATISPPVGTAEGTSSAPGFITPAPRGTANNTASVDVTSACADLSIVKSNAQTSVVSGDLVAYTLLVSNAGPAAADGAVVADPQTVGLDCNSGTLICGSEIGGAVCPALLTVAGLQGVGLVIPTFPAGGSLQFTLTCTVSASGNP